jgi:hypothetical protein
MEIVPVVLSLTFIGASALSMILCDRHTGGGRASVLLQAIARSALALWIAVVLLVVVWPLAVLVVLVLGWSWTETLGALRCALAHGDPVEGSRLGSSAREAGIAEPWAVEARCRLCRLTVQVPGRESAVLERALHPKLVRRVRNLEMPAPISLRVLGEEVAVDWAPTRQAWFELDPTTTRLAAP